MKQILIRILITTLFSYLSFNSLGQTKSEINQIYSYLRRASSLNDQNSDSALYYLRKADNLSVIFPNSAERCSYFWILGDYYKLNKNFTKAEEAYEKMHKIAVHLNNENQIKTSLYSKATVKVENGEFLDGAHVYFSLEDFLLKGIKKGGDKITNRSNKNLLFLTYNNLAYLFKELQDRKRNEIYLKKMEPLVETEYDSLLYVFALSTYSLNPNHHLFYKPALKMAIAQKDTFSIKEIYSEMGHWHAKRKDFTNALDYAQNSLNIKLKMDNGWKYDLINFYTSGLVYLHLGELDKAEYFLKKAHEGFKENGQLDYQFKVLFDLSKLYQKKNVYKEAFDSFTLGQSIKDSLIGTEQQNRISQLNIDFQESLHQKELVASANEKKLIWFLLSLSVLFLAYISFSYFQKNKVNERLAISKKKLEEQAYLLKETNATKDKLFAIISHDLRGPINNLVNYMYLLEDNYTPPKDYVSKLRFNIENVQVVLNNLFNWAEMQIKNSPPKIKLVNIDDIILQVLSQFEDKILEKEIMVEDNLNNGKIYADENYLHIILRNIISNAVKFTPPKGKIKINASNLTNESIIAIADSGVGISDEQIEGVLNYPVSKDGTNHEKGSGLGLTLCNELMNKQEGSLSIISGLGKGTEIILKFPYYSNS